MTSGVLAMTGGSAAIASGSRCDRTAKRLPLSIMCTRTGETSVPGWDESSFAGAAIVGQRGRQRLCYCTLVPFIGTRERSALKMGGATVIAGEVIGSSAAGNLRDRYIPVTAATTRLRRTFSRLATTLATLVSLATTAFACRDVIDPASRFWLLRIRL
jgi:hypothetical protein